MTSPDRSKGNRSRDEVLAGEYVLGVLSSNDRRLVEERLTRDLAFATIVRRWQDNLLTVDDGVTVSRPPVRFVTRAPPAPLKAAGMPVKQRPPRRGLWQSLAFWRMLTAIAWIGMLAMVAVDALKP
ncbi:hypothetical protein P7F60_03015 [Rhizobium sp. YJ-22]|uniref:hypothetical protein n=1 Tax=Rhizobium sp. YJ-22 TaxID=3037556 RepID=UPI0024124CF9|nr:hypothetical protein [Rhizobium sp. YJ-22]MDG3575344.1 hypothetical protein [Rhizobium sp. YJ-22]